MLDAQPPRSSPDEEPEKPVIDADTVKRLIETGEELKKQRERLALSRERGMMDV